MTERLLIIDDDRELCTLLREFLQLEGFAVDLCHDGREALLRCRQENFDGIVLDIMLPGMWGLEVLRKLRERLDTPVLMLTARGEDTDRIIGLELGADDYLPKPCNPRELAARLRAILRRGRSAEPAGNGDLRVGLTHLSSADRSASWNERDLELTSAEFNILNTLLTHAGSVVDKESLSRQALGRSLSAYDRSVDVHVSKIRKKFAACGADNPIVSIRGAGYQFNVSAAEHN
ncbi:response regulator transcription factor [Haliea sp. E1-2-M8]|uniref:response regulator transcription factor n=1 Tax=Haliea sp. E1-2-M8 TaxID=3064706 RepID=UPI002716C56D|nr:response regulator transcription factor [Haliea sp. E1-2-M8]MDO8861211.1 response regulator transcription factor [Haliea sp. E1-2-M8]